MQLKHSQSVYYKSQYTNIIYTQFIKMSMEEHYMKKEDEEIMEDILKERIEENKELFSKEELTLLNNNVNIIKKIYLLGAIDINI